MLRTINISLGMDFSEGEVMSTEEQKAAWREAYHYYYERAKSLHRCYLCGKDTEPKPGGGYYAHCPEHLAKIKAYVTAKRAKRKAEHKCVVCGTPVTKINPKTGRHCLLCPSCQTRHNESNKKWVEKNF